MLRLPRLSRQKWKIGQSVGGGLFLTGAIWLVLLGRDFGLNVLAADATPSSRDAFYQTATLVSTAVALTFVGMGMFLLVRCRRGRRQADSEHGKHRRRSRSAAPLQPVPVPRSAGPARIEDDETVSLEPVNSVLGDDIPNPAPRTKRRIRVRVRVRKDKTK